MRVTTIAAAAVGAIVLLAWLLNPVRESFLQQRELQQQQQSAPPMTDFVPATVTGVQGLAYGAQPRERMDVWFPENTPAGQRLPVIVWVHGGGWIGGSRANVTPYAQILAGRGFATVGLDYSLAPGARFPTQVQQLDAALSYLAAHADALHVDPDRIVLAGDSGGAHIAAQLAAAVTDPSTAAAMGVTPAVQPDQLAGLLLACPALDLRRMARLGGVVEDYVEAYAGTTSDEARLTAASVGPGVTEAFPPTWLATGNADPLTPQVETFAKLLTSAGVDVDSMFWADDHDPPLGHEYQFNLGLAESLETLESAVAFARRHTGLSPQ